MAGKREWSAGKGRKAKLKCMAYRWWLHHYTADGGEVYQWFHTFREAQAYINGR